MRRIRLFLVAVATVTMVLFFTVPALAYGPRGLTGEGRTDIKEGRHFIQQGKLLDDPREIRRGNQAIREGHQDIRRGQRGDHGH
jgi:hypothetical protein